MSLIITLLLLISSIIGKGDTETTDDGLYSLGNRTDSTVVITHEGAVAPVNRGLSIGMIVYLGRQMSIYKASKAIENIGSLTLAAIGLTGNKLSGVVLYHQGRQRISCYTYMAVLTLTDSLALILTTISWILEDVIHLTLDPAPFQSMCSFLLTSISFTSVSGTYVILAMTFDRLIAVRWPLKALIWCTTKRAKITSGVIILLCLVFKLPYIWVTGTVPPVTCVPFQVDITPLVTSYQWLNSCMTCYIPFSILLILNGMTIHALRMRGKELKKMTGTDDSSNVRTASTTVKDDASSSSTTSMKSNMKRILNNSKPSAGTGTSGDDKHTKERKASRSDASLAAMLLLVTFSFLFLTLPVNLFYLVYLVRSKFVSPFAYAEFALFGHIASNMFQMNYSISFYLYCIGGSKFRNDLISVLKKLCHMK